MADDKEIVIRISAKNLTQAEFDSARKGIAGVTGETEKAKAKTIGVGEAFRDAFKTAAYVGAAVVGTVTAITAAITALGVRGADVADVSNQFDILNDQIGTSADSLLVKLRSAMAGTISDFDLMKSTNQSLSQGLKLTEDQFSLTAKASRVLADRIGGDAKTAYETLMMAMATGQDRTLKTIGLNIDAGAAVDALARALGRQTSELTESQQITAKKNAILQELQRTLKVSGEAEVDFGDRVKQVTTFLVNLRDEFAEGIAQSSVLSAGLGGAADAITAAFGGNQTTLVQTLVRWIERLAMFVVDSGLVLVEWGRTGAQIFGALQIPVRAITVGFVDLTSTMANALAAIVEMSAEIPGIGSHFQSLATAARATADTWEGLSVGTHKLLADSVAMAKGQGVVHETLDKVSNVLVTMKSRMEAATLAQNTQTAATAKHATVVRATASEIDQISDAQLKKLQQRLKEELEERTRVAGEIRKYQDAAAAGLMAQEGKHYGMRKAALDEYNKLVAERTLSSFDFKLFVIEQEGNAVKAGLDQQASNYKETLAAIDRMLEERRKKAMSEEFIGPIWDPKQLAKTFAENLKDGLKANLANVAQTIAHTLESGGNWTDAAKSIASQIGASLGSSIGGLFGPLGEKIGSAIGSMAGLLVPAFKKLFGIGINEEVKKANTEIEKLRQGLLSTHGPLDQLEAKANAVGLSFKEAWGHQGKQGLEQFKKLIEEFNKKTEEAEARLQRIKAASEAAVSGFAAIVVAMTEPYDKAAEKVKAAQKEIDDLRKKMDDAKSVTAEMGEDMARAQDKLTEALAAQHALAEGAKQTLADLGVQATATFAAAILAGKSYSEALKAAGPGLADLRKAYQDLGLDVEDVGLKHLMLQATVQESNPSLIAATDALGTSMSALAQLGLLNVDTFGAMQRTGAAMYARLQGEVAALGGDTRDALLPMQGYLREAAARAEELGIPLDANTQLLIAQSEELGIWKEKGKSAQDKLIEGMQELVKKVGELLDKVLGVSVAISSIPPKVTSDIVVNHYDNYFENHEGESNTMPFASGSKDVTGSWFPNFSSVGTRIIAHGREALVPESQTGRFIRDNIDKAGITVTAPAPAPVYILVDPSANDARQISEGEFRQIQARFNTGGLTVPVRAITQRGLA